MKPNAARFASALPFASALIALGALALWWTAGTGEKIKLRFPGLDQPPGAQGAALVNPVLAGALLKGVELPSLLSGNWPGFRGPTRSGSSSESVSLARSWDAAGPRQLWSIDLGEGYAGAAVLAGRVYLTDYDREKKESSLRCLSLANGKEIWRYAYPISIKRNHGMTRTVPAIANNRVVAIDAKCNVLCLDAATGERRWGLNLVREFGTTVPPWYTGQCPLVDGTTVVLAPGGRDALLAGLDLDSGQILWKTPNPRGWKMTHSSIMPLEFAGQRFYAYCASGGVAGVAARSGILAWETTDWKISIATVPSPLPIGNGKIFLSGGYNAGSLILQIQAEGEKFLCKIISRLPPEQFGATQHTPIYHDNHIFGIRADGQFVCLDPSGKIAWSSGPAVTFGLGPFLIANDLIFALNDSGKLSLLEASPSHFRLLAQAQILSGRESWAPLALAGDRLIARDLTHMVCIDIAGGTR